MRLLLILPVLLLIANQATGQVDLLRHSDSIYVSVNRFYAQENSVVFVGPDYVSVIGATWTPETAELLHERISEFTAKPIKEVVNTNYHPDRAGGNAYWKELGCEIHSTEATFDLLGEEWQSICEWTRIGIPGYPEVKLSLPTTTHKGSFELHGGRIHVLYLGPSHTKDGVFVYFPEEGVLYGGCIIKPFLGNLEHADLVEYPKTLEKLKEQNLNISSVIAGHGAPIHIADLIDRYIELLKDHTSTR